MGHERRCESQMEEEEGGSIAALAPQGKLFCLKWMEAEALPTSLLLEGLT